MRTGTDLGEDGDADVLVAGLVDERGQLVGGQRGGDGLLPGLRRQADRQVLLVSQQVRAGLGAERRGSANQSRADRARMGFSLTRILFTALYQLGLPKTSFTGGNWNELLDVCVRVSYRVELLHLLPQHAGDHPDQAPVFEVAGLLVEVAEQRADGGAFTVDVGVKVHPSEEEEEVISAHLYIINTH